MKNSHWLLFALAIICPMLVGISFLLKYKEVAHYESVLYLAGGFLIGFILIALKELFTLLRDIKKPN